MNILCTCAEGTNRSVTFAHILKYVKDFETMTLGLEYHSWETQQMLFKWADLIIVPERYLLDLIPKKYRDKVKFYDIGPDVYPRPHNPELYAKIKRLLEKDRIA
jgi:predicted protein tyrosine phosphatase